MLSIYLIIIIGISLFIQYFRARKDPIYKYYMPGLFAKLICSVCFCLIYIYYYNGGDTVSYYETARAMVNLALSRPSDFFIVYFEKSSFRTYMLFDTQTGYPWPYMFFEPNSCFVAKSLVPILLLSFKSYLVASVVLGWLSYTGAWQLFKMFVNYFPQLTQRMAIAALFVPSTLFWGSGILKDTFTLAATCWFIVGFNSLLISKRKRFKSLLIILLSTYVLFSIKPYILFALLPGSIIWLFYSRISRISSRILRYLTIPLIFLGSVALGVGVLSLVGDSMGKFSVGKALKTAATTQQDLRQSYYRGNSFDIGEYDASYSGILSKAPMALMAGLYQPFIWQANNVVMLLSGLENFIYLLITLLIVRHIFIRPQRIFRIMVENPLLIFMFSYSILFAVMVGLTTSNFGALVRFKIPFLPTMVCSLLVMHYFLSKHDQYREMLLVKEKRKEQAMLSDSNP
jgi:hypothetical protein